MSRRGLVALVLGFAAILGYALWLDRPSEDEAAAEKRKPVLLDFAPEQVRRTVLARGGATVTLERDSTEAWRIESPFEAEADAEQVQSLLQTVSGAHISRVVEEEPTSEAPFGLAPPEAELRIETEEGAPEKVLRLGRPSPVGFERYVSIGDGRILLVDGALATALLREPKEFRQKRLAPVEAGSVGRVALFRDRGRIVVERSEGRWALREPVRDLGDAAACDSLARSLTRLAVSRLAEPDEVPALLSAFAKPSLVAEVVIEGGRSYRLQVAVREQENEWPARRVGSSVIGWVQSSEAKDLLERDADDLRERRLVLVSLPDVLEVKVEGPGRSLRLRREKEGEPWRLEGAPGEAGIADAEKVEDFLDRLQWLRGTPAEGETAPASWAIGIRLGGGSADLGRLEIGAEIETRSGQGVEKRRLARSTWRPGFLFSLAAEALGAVPSTPADLVPEEAGPTEGNPAEVAR